MPDLLPFQRHGAAFLAMRRRALLADEMRVGKTPQAIAATEKVGARSILVLCPAIARFNWLREFVRWAGVVGTAISTTADEPDPTLTVCSYSLLIQKKVYAKLARRWDVVICDESHFLKNDEAKRTDAAYKIGVAAGQLWCLSGTPSPGGHAGELHPTLFAFGATKFPFPAFVNRYCIVDENTGKIICNKPEMVSEIRALLAPVMLRRKLAEVAPEMPLLRWETVVVPPGTVDPALARAALAECNEDGGTGHDGFRHWVYAKRLAEKLAEAKDEIDLLDPRDSLWFRRYCALQKIEPVVELLKAELDATSERIVVFGWHVDALRAIAQAVGGAVIDGSVSHNARQRIIDDFQGGRFRVVCAQIVAAGTAIDLSVADEVLFVEQSWTPSDNAQAAMRVVSQFKTRPTRARVVSIAGSIDEAVQRSLLKKTRMVDQILN